MISVGYIRSRISLQAFVSIGIIEEAVCQLYVPYQSGRLHSGNFSYIRSTGNIELPVPNCYPKEYGILQHSFLETLFISLSPCLFRFFKGNFVALLIMYYILFRVCSFYEEYFLILAENKSGISRKSCFLLNIRKGFESGNRIRMRKQHKFITYPQKQLPPAPFLEK